MSAKHKGKTWPGVIKCVFLNMFVETLLLCWGQDAAVMCLSTMQRYCLAYSGEQQHHRNTCWHLALPNGQILIKNFPSLVIHLTKQLLSMCNYNCFTLCVCVICLLMRMSESSAALHADPALWIFAPSASWLWWGATQATSDPTAATWTTPSTLGMYLGFNAISAIDHS